MKISKIAAIFAVGSLLLATGCQTNAEEEGSTPPNVTIDKDGNATLIINEYDTASGFISAVKEDGTEAKLNTVNVDNKYSGEGYLEYVDTATYSVYSKEAQNVKMSIMYAHWGSSTQIKAAYVTVGGTTYKDESQILYCNHTGKKLALSNEVSIPLKAGNNQIKLTFVPKGTVLPKYDEAKGYGVKYPNGATDEESATNSGTLYQSDGCMGNLDYLKVVGKDITGGGEVNEKYYSVKTTVANSSYGTISIEPQQDSFLDGTEITVTATPSEGYVFDSWCGTNTDTTGTFKIKVTKDLSFEANFISSSFDKTTLNGLEGYATVCDDEGTTYTITGGFGGGTITLSKLEDLTTYKSQISGNDPYIIKVTDRISTTTNKSETFDIGSNKTLIGEKGQDYGFKNINPKISGTNVIVKYLHFGEVIGDDYWGGSGNDALSIKGGKHVWIDHCEFSSKSVPTDIVTGNEIKFTDYNFVVDTEGEDCTPKEKWAKDFYDGLLDVSEQSRFISVSNSYFHDHQKACLCGGSNDKAETQPQGSLVRMTFYNNYFENIHSRQPLFRFGRAHIYSSYYKGTDSSSGIEVRAESLVNVNSCYFEGFNSEKVVGCWNSSSGLGQGKWNVQNCEGAKTSYTNTFEVPYKWTKTSATDSKTNLPSTAGIK